MAKNLLIVESPAKAKTIEKILGKDFEVKSCFGHIRDLSKEGMGVEVENNYIPKYIIPKDKEKVIKELKAAAKKSSEIWLASDEDREGESISWHLAEVLNLDPSNTKRIVFHEITTKAIKNAVANPRIINLNLVNAQQARRVLDRLVGFELSPVLWKKIGNKSSLSAGRVQSVAVKLIVEREREIQKFNTQSFFKIEGLFTEKVNGKNIQFKAESKTIYNQKDGALKFLESCKKALYKIVNIDIKPGKKSPAPPFITSTLQQEASRKLGYSVSRTMTLAQKLYETGHITYMRTDSVNISEQALDGIKLSISELYGNNYYKKRHFKNKNESAQEAHEAIRPTDFSVQSIADESCKKLYEMIWKRTIASQMADAEIERTEISIEISTNKQYLIATGEVIKFPGFLSVYNESKDETTEDELNENEPKILPILKLNEYIQLVNLTANEKFTKPLPRYTEASLVKKMEDLGIGRPSTYAPTISTIINRNYVEKNNKEGQIRTKMKISLDQHNSIEISKLEEKTGVEKNKLFPTDLGLIVTDFLITHFQQIMDFEFTANIEKEFDEIASGNLQWQKMIDLFYVPFHHKIQDTTKNANRTVGERELGIDEKTGKKIYARMGRFGPIVQLGESNDEEKARFASLQPGQSIETINLDEALKLFILPRIIGEFENVPLKANIGRFGPYIQHGSKFYSIGNSSNPYTINIEEAIKIIEGKRIKESNKIILQFPELDIQVLNGQFGPYIKQGKNNYKINKKHFPDPKNLLLKDIEEIINEQKTTPKKKFRNPKKA